MIKYWLYLLLASVFETAWIFSLKLLNFKVLKELSFENYFSLQGFSKLSPLLGYIVFGIANTYLFAVAIKQIPMASAMAIWMALSLIFIKIAELVFFQGKFSWIETFFLMLITVGIIGLKVISK